MHRVRALGLALLVASVACGGGDPAEPTPDAAPPPPPPDTTLTEGPAEITRATTATFMFTASEAGASFECSLDGAAFAACAPPVTLTVAEGEHAFAARARTAGGGLDPDPARLVWRVDLTPPQTTIDLGPDPQMEMSEARFVFVAGETASFECSVDAAAPFICETGVVVSELALGKHTFAVRAVDVAANRDDTPATWEWTVTRTTPNTRIISKPESPWRDAAVTFEFDSDLPGARFECRLDVEEPEPCVSPMVYDLEEKEWTFEVVAIDPDGRRDPTPARHLVLVRYPFW